MRDQLVFDHERTDFRTTGIAWLAAGLALFVVVTPLLMPLIFPQSMQHRKPLAPPALVANAPGLEVMPREDFRKIERTQAEFGSSYGWTDRSRGVVRIPIARAMELLAERGLEGWPKP